MCGSSRACPAASAYLLDISMRDLERILYFEAFVVVDPNESRSARATGSAEEE